MNGSSTIGVKKSTVCTRARSSERRYTAASSAVSKPTSKFSSCCRANFPSTLSSTAGLSLDAQPAALTDSVRRNGFTSGTGSIVDPSTGFTTEGTEGHRGKLLHGHICDRDIRVLMVPLRGDAVEGEPEVFTFTRS